MSTELIELQMQKAEAEAMMEVLDFTVRQIGLSQPRQSGVCFLLASKILPQLVAMQEAKALDDSAPGPADIAS